MSLYLSLTLKKKTDVIYDGDTPYYWAIHRLITSQKYFKIMFQIANKISAL
jgi:hypothetical protein